MELALEVKSKFICKAHNNQISSYKHLLYVYVGHNIKQKGLYLNLGWRLGVFGGLDYN